MSSFVYIFPSYLQNIKISVGSVAVNVFELFNCIHFKFRKKQKSTILRSVVIDIYNPRSSCRVVSQSSDFRRPAPGNRRFVLVRWSQLFTHLGLRKKAQRLPRPYTNNCLSIIVYNFVKNDYNATSLSVLLRFALIWNSLHMHWQPYAWCNITGDQIWKKRYV